MAVIRNFRLPLGIGVSADYIETYGVIESSNTNTGSIVARGGIGVSGNIFMGGNLSIGNSVIAGTWGGSAITGRYGGTGYTTYTKGDLLVGVGSTFIKLPVGSQGQLLQAFSSATSGVAWTSIVAPTYGAFYSTQTQTVTGAGVSTPLTYNATFEAYNTQIFGGAGTSSRIQIQSAGTYNIQFSAQINLAAGNQPQKGDFWFRINGSDVPQSNTTMTISGKDYETILSLNFISYFAANDYFELIMASSDAHFQIHAESALTSPPRPDVPSIILTIVPVTQIVGSSAGLGVSGIVSLNGLNNYIQYFAVGNNGSDFNISSSSQTHTINIPIAGSGATGLVTGIAQTFEGSKTFSANTIISSSTASTSTTSGALVASGGVGIGQSISVGGRLQMFNSSNYTAFVSSASGNTVYTLPATSPATGSSVLQSTSAGVMSWVPMVASASSGATSANVSIVAAGASNLVHSILFTPSSLSAGSAISSDSTISFNPSTEILNVSGLAVTSGTASTNTTTGALVVRGGLGVTGQLSFATASFGFTGIATNPTMSFIGATSSSPITLTVLTDNSLNFEGSQGSVFSIDSNLSTGEIFSVSDISGLPIISASAGQTVTFNEFGGYAQFGNGSINSSSTTTGSLVVSGGIGITGNANIGGTVRLTNTTASTSSTTGAMTVSGGVGIGGSASIAGRLQLFNSSNFTAFVSSATGNTVYTLPATSPATGSSVLQSTSAGVMSWVPMVTSSSGEGSGTVAIPGAQFQIAAYYTGTGASVSGSATLTNNTTNQVVNISHPTNSTNPSNGALTVFGGVGIGQSVSIIGRLQMFSGVNYTAFVSSATGNTVYTLPATSPATGSAVLQSTSAGVMSWVSTASFGASVGGVLDGSVQYKSGSGFAGTRDLWYDQTYKSFRLGNFPGEEITNNNSAALLIEQAIGSFNGAFAGNLIGVNALNTFTGDLINLQTNAVTRFRVGADGGMGVSSLSSSGNVVITSNTNSTSTTTGALVVTGGMGIGGNAFIGGTTTITNTTASVSSSSGALVVAGGVGIGQTLFIGGNLYQNTNAITAHSTGFRNRIINGDFNIDQRNSGATVVPSSTQNVTDRWKMNINGSGRVTSGQNYGAVSSPSPFVSYYGMKVTTTTTPGSGDYNFFSQVIEGPNINDLQWGTANAQTVTLSFWAYSSLTGTFGGSVRNFGGFSRSYPFTYTISSANTWEKKTVVIPGDTTGTWTVSTAAGIELIFIIANGSTFQSAPGAWAAGNFHGPSGSLANLIGTLNSTLYITGVQIELGTAATPFEKRNYGHEFSLCQRYYQITEVRVGGYHTTGGEFRGSAYLNTAMRPIASPVFTVLATDESVNLGSLAVDNSNFRGDSYRFITVVTTTGTAYGQWKVSADCEF